MRSRTNMLLTLAGLAFAVPGASAPAAQVHPIAGKWRYQSGSFTDVHIYHEDGRVTAPASTQSRATWRVEGNELVSRWNNGWQNRLALPVTGDRVSGVSVSPQGQRAPITLTRIRDAAAASETVESHPVVGTWRYQSGSFTDVHIYHQDGRVTAPASTENHATWRVEGNELVSRWNNGWQNRLALPVTGDRVSGVSVSPQGQRAPITLTRIPAGSTR